jgi:hypothetical protein
MLLLILDLPIFITFLPTSGDVRPPQESTCAPIMPASVVVDASKLSQDRINRRLITLIITPNSHQIPTMRKYTVTISILLMIHHVKIPHGMMPSLLTGQEVWFGKALTS